MKTLTKLLIVLTIFTIGACERTDITGIPDKQDRDSKQPDTTKYIKVISGKDTYKSPHCWIEYVPEINCYVLNIQQENCGTSIPIEGTELKVDFLP